MQMCLVQNDSGLPSSGDNSSMDDKIWKNLPTEILESVLEWLPLSSMLRCRAVCKGWHRLLSSSMFLKEKWKQKSLIPVGINVFVGKGGEQTVLPPGVRLHKFVFPFFSFAPYPCAAAGGLICFSAGSVGLGAVICEPFVICNPLTGNWKRLPSLPNSWNRLRDQFVELISAVVTVELNVDYGSKTYALRVCLNFLSQVQFTFLAQVQYESGSGAWATLLSDLICPCPRTDFLMGCGRNYREHVWVPAGTPETIYRVEMCWTHDRQSVKIWKKCGEAPAPVCVMPHSDFAKIFQNWHQYTLSILIRAVDDHICIFVSFPARPGVSNCRVGLITYHLTTKSWSSWVADGYLPNFEKCIFSLNPMASQIAL